MKLILTDYSVHYYAHAKPLIKNFSFTCEKAGIYLVYGANGTGKSTLFKSILGDAVPAKITGSLSHEGKMFDITSQFYKKYAHAHVAIVPQKYDELLAPHYTIRENLSLAQLPSFPSLFTPPPATLISPLLREIKIPLDTPVELLSGGQRQIAAIMMALQKSKKILLLDEPTATLDPVNTALVMEFLVRLQQETGILILMICHDPELKKYTEYEPIMMK